MKTLSDKPNIFGKTTEEVTEESKSSSTQNSNQSQGNNKPASTKPAESKLADSKPRTTEEATTECNHKWVARYKTVHHDAVTHTEEQKVCVREAYTEDIYDWLYNCNCSR